jgi:hypothetical protein
MPVECESRPVKKLVLLGQHKGFSTNALVNVSPFPTSSDSTVGISDRLSHR